MKTKVKKVKRTLRPLQKSKQKLQSQSHLGKKTKPTQFSVLANMALHSTLIKNFLLFVHKNKLRNEAHRLLCRSLFKK